MSDDIHLFGRFLFGAHKWIHQCGKNGAIFIANLKGSV